MQVYDMVDLFAYSKLNRVMATSSFAGFYVKTVRVGRE